MGYKWADHMYRYMIRIHTTQNKVNFFMITIFDIEVCSSRGVVASAPDLRACS